MPVLQAHKWQLYAPVWSATLTFANLQMLMISIQKAKRDPSG